MKSNRRYSFLFLVFVAACANVPKQVVTTETEPPRWRPGLVIEKYFLPFQTETAVIKFDNPNLELPMHSLSSGDWRADLDQPKLAALLAGEHTRVQHAKILCASRDSKGRILKQEVAVDVEVKESSADSHSKYSY